MQTEVKKFQTEANDKAVDELVHLERVKDLLVELKKQVPLEEPPKHWGYVGEEGPAHWAELDPEYKTCGGFHEAAVACREFIVGCQSHRSHVQSQFAVPPENCMHC